MDRITETLIRDFLNLLELQSEGIANDFERFVNYSILSKEYTKTFDIDTVTVAAGNDTGIDGIGILVNGHLVEDIDEVNDLIEKNGYLEVTYIFIQSKTSSTFIFADKATLPDLQGIKEAYYGILPFQEFIKILVDEDDKIRNIFDDNVRDFQGEDNPVNQVIGETLKGDRSELFSVLNNGVTIVAHSLKPSGNNFTISDYQIVNGCQTSNVLFNHRHLESVQKLSIPLKLIITEDEDVKNQITIATNSQTAIKREQLAALSDFQKNLEHYYSSMEGEGKLYYERRSKQYSSDNSVIKTRIITIPIQIKSFSAMYQKNPHLVTSYFGSIVKKLGTSGSPIFSSDHQFIPYYAAGLAYYRLDAFFRAKTIDPKYKKVRFHLLMLFRLLATPGEPPPMNSARRTESYCQPILESLNDSTTSLELFQKAIDILYKADIDINNKQHFKQASITENLIKSYEELYGSR